MGETDYRRKLVFRQSTDMISTHICFLFYIYFISFVSFISMNILILCNVHPSAFTRNFLNDCRGLSFQSMTYVKIYFFILCSYICKKYLFENMYDKLCKRYRRHTLSPANIIFGKYTNKVKQILSILILSTLLLNFLLIGIVNPSLLNPGPQNLPVFYQNAQGLIPFSQLANPHPTLDRTKIFELNAHIALNKPAVIMLTETWLKKSINDNEIIESPDYYVFRNDRSQLTHPPDPNNPKKFRKFGGGS